VSKAQAERSLRGGAEDHGSKGRNSVTSWCRIIFPAGLEIDNPHSGPRPATTGTLDWIEDGEGSRKIPNFRDDQLHCGHRSCQRRQVGIYGRLLWFRAVSPGNYVLPQAYVEDHVTTPRAMAATGTGSVEVRPAEMSASCGKTSCVMPRAKGAKRPSSCQMFPGHPRPLCPQ